MLNRVCRQCGTEFNVFPSKLNSGRGKFCSTDCYHRWRKGRDFSTTEVRSQAAKQCWANPVYQEHKMPSQIKSLTKLQLGAKEALLKPEHRAAISRRIEEQWRNPSYRNKVTENMSKSRLQFYNDHPEEIAKVSKTMNQKWQTEKFKNRKPKMAEQMRKLWQDPSWVAKRVAALNKRPNRLEKQLQAILDKRLPEFQYNGDFSLGITLAGYIPDFININGRKELIEVFGDYYHSPEVLEDRWQGSELGKIMIYNSLGWRCLIIWEHELKKLTEDEVVTKISDFFH